MDTLGQTHTGTTTDFLAQITGGRAGVLVGAPGTGKTYRLLELATEFMAAGSDPARLLVLTPSRTSATRFRDALTKRINTTFSAAPTRAWQAYAYDILRRAHAAELLPGLDFAPKLLSGPEQDVMIKELLEGHRRFLTGPRWPDELGEAIATRGFRHEVRDFFDRLAEYNLDPQTVAQWGERTGTPEWVAAAQLYTEYQQVRRLRAPNAFDPSALIHEAVRVLMKNPDFLAAERTRFDLVLVDDLQEASPSIYRLLAVLTGTNLAYLLQGHKIASGDDPLVNACALAPTAVLSLCTDTVVQGFRGARPDYVGKIRDMYEDLVIETLETSYRMPEDIASAWVAVAERIPHAPAGLSSPRVLASTPETEYVEQALPPLGDDHQLLDPEKSAGNDAALETFTVDTPQLEGALLAQMILEDRLHRGRSYSRSVVIVRNGAEVQRIKRILEAQGIPVATSAAETPVRDEPAVRPFLDALRLVIQASTSQTSVELEPVETESAEGEQPDEETAATGAALDLGFESAVALLSSRLGGASAMDIRSLRQVLRGAELRAGGTRSSETLLVEALLDPELLPGGREGIAARRVARVLQSGSRALEEPGATAETVLWALWEASGLADIWHKASATDDTTGIRAHRDLDAIIGLFEAASRYVDQMPGATAAQFLDYIDSQDLPMDTLAARVQTIEAVEILTPATAAGRSWDIVYVSGLQEGVWPNTTVRGTLLRTQELIDTVEYGPDIARTMTYTQRVRDTRADELRMFSAAISRASQRLICTAASTNDFLPSELLDIVAPTQHRENVEVRRPMTLRALVAELRQYVADQDADPVRAHHAAALLHRLKDKEQTNNFEVPGARPDSWWGLLPLSSGGTARPAEEPVRISPSLVETIHTSPLDWFVQAARAEALTDVSRSIGSLIHAIAEEMPEASEADLLTELRQRFTTLNLPDTWETDKLFERAQEMMSKFATYVSELPSTGRSLVGIEGSFSVFVPGPAKDAILSGRADRLEIDQAGKYVIIDLKTSKAKPSKSDLEKHPQLASYQVALEAGAGEQMVAELQNSADSPRPPAQDTTETALPHLMNLQELSGGAWLIQLGDGTKKLSQQEQPPLTTEDAWAVELINRAAELISLDTFQARHGTGSAYTHGCKLPEICPLCARGRQITQS
ncbi:ATP-dependent DNA helicase [Rothia sp. ZJ932]|uniref:ATP-dependent helicase n=1 Tax=Rothia sp. ZJ932 TaxID=2810516 RepID=UPI00196778B2|nr:ATP-dependent DNA helicase [Rothia sp. ZJ932]QRZ62225.1 ATP-dependent helicase [Rothia sp. ZJ932]